MFTSKHIVIIFRNFVLEWLYIRKSDHSVLYVNEVGKVERKRITEWSGGGGGSCGITTKCDPSWGSTEYLTGEVRQQLLLTSRKAVSVFSCGHVIPPGNILPITLSHGNNFDNPKCYANLPFY